MIIVALQAIIAGAVGHVAASTFCNPDGSEIAREFTEAIGVSAGEFCPAVVWVARMAGCAAVAAGHQAEMRPV